MKNKMKFLGIIALVAIIGFSMTACPTGGGRGGGGGAVETGSGQYTGTDAKGNTYKLYVGSDASRAAIKGDNFRLEITLDGKTYIVTGTVTEISNDGTLTLKPSRGDTFSAVVKGNNLNSVTGPSGGIPELTSDNGQKFTPRSFPTIHLRANWWEDSYGPWYQWDSGASVLVKDFPTDVKKITNEPHRYAITVKGTSDTNLDFLGAEIHGLKGGKWDYIASGTINGKKISANREFTETFVLIYFGDNSSFDLTNYDEIRLQVSNGFMSSGSTWEVRNGTRPANITQGQIMATITNFRISLEEPVKPSGGYDNKGSYYTGNIYNTYSVSAGTATDAVIVIPSTYNGLPVTEISIQGFYENENITNITIPNSVTTIENRAFEGCKNLTSITIPNSVTIIGWAAFSGCKSLKSITLPNGLTGYIGYGTFYGCESLTSITIPNGITRFDGNAFNGCTNLKSITIPNSVTFFNTEFGGLFYNCTSLTSITIPNGVPSIGKYTFSYCTSLTSITIPNSVTSIDVDAFSSCDKLKTVNYGGTQAQWNAIMIGSGNEDLKSATINYK